MNHITRQPRSADPTTTSATRATPTAETPRRPDDDQPSAADRPGIRLTWRKLDRLESAATLGMILASPRSALVMLDRLGSRIPPSSATAVRHPRAVTARRRIS
jgi:hypothetical protein